MLGILRAFDRQAPAVLGTSACDSFRGAGLRAWGGGGLTGSSVQSLGTLRESARHKGCASYHRFCIAL